MEFWISICYFLKPSLTKSMRKTGMSPNIGISDRGNCRHFTSIFIWKKNKNKTLWLTLWIISWNGKFYPTLSWPITGKIQRRCQKPIWARSPKKLFSQWMIKRRVKEKIAFYMEVKMIKKNKNCIFSHQVLTIAFTESFWLLNNVLLHCWESSTTTFDFIK